MAGEIEEPVRLDFKADSLHSGSISFGRFESEALCWERRSSFSHNRYLEEVEKCSKPGSVTEKKAYFEAHFRKKGILCLNSPESQNGTEYQTSDNERSEKTGYDEEISHKNAETHSPQFDENLDGSTHGSEHEVMEQERGAFGSSNLDALTELSYDCTNNVDSVSDHGKVEEPHQAIPESLLPAYSRSDIEVKVNLDGEAANSDASHVSNATIELFSDSHAIEESSDASHKGQQGSSSKEKIPSQAENMQPRLGRRVSVAQSGRYIACKEASTGSEKKPSKTVNNVLVRLKAEKKISVAAAQDKCPMKRAPKYEPISKATGVREIKSGDKESRNRLIEVPQSSTLQKVPSRVRQSETRIKPAVGVTQPCIEQDSSRLSSKCSERTERRKQLGGRMQAKDAQMHQFQAKAQEQTKDEIKQLRKSLNFKATPPPSFNRGVLRESDRNKAIASNVQTQKVQTKSSSTGSRVFESSRLSSAAGKDRSNFIRTAPKTTDPPQASGATSCHSTVTSESSTSSPAAEISKGHHSQAVVNSRVGGKREKDQQDKLTSMHKHKAPQHQKIYKGKTKDGKQKIRTESGLIIRIAYEYQSTTG